MCAEERAEELGVSVEGREKACIERERKRERERERERQALIREEEAAGIKCVCVEYGRVRAQRGG